MLISNDLRLIFTSTLFLAVPITFHAGRHTMATTVCLSNSMPIETVSSILGHKNIRTTQIYAKITKEKVKKDMTALAAQLNSVEEFAGVAI